MDGVELGVEARPDRAAVPVVRRRVVDQGCSQEGGEPWSRPDAGREVAQRQRLGPGQGVGDCGERLQRAAESDQLPCGGKALGGTCGQPLEAPHPAERLAQLAAAARVTCQLVDRAEPELDPLDVPQRRPEPAAQPPGADR